MGDERNAVMEPSLRLVEPDAAYASAFLEMAEEFQAAGEFRYDEDLPVIRGDFPRHVAWLQRLARGEGLASGYVPSQEFWLLEVESGKILGTIRLRYWLTPALTHSGGNIGYNIRPGARRRGYGKRMLALLLDLLRDPAWRARRGLALKRVLITCDPENTGSARIIEANGGVLENQVIWEDERVSRYWIDLFPGGAA